MLPEQVGKEKRENPSLNKRDVMASIEIKLYVSYEDLLSIRILQWSAKTKRFFTYHSPQWRAYSNCAL
jgi:hypothetical protein